MVSTRSAVNCGGGQHGEEWRRLPRGRLSTEAVETLALLKKRNTRQWDSA
jgi:hypothetical protein